MTVVAPGGFAIRRGGEKPDPLTDGDQAERNPIYDDVGQRIAAFVDKTPGGDPAAVAQALLKIVDAENPPLRVFFGPQGYQIIQKVYADRLETWADWQDLSIEAHGESSHDPGPTAV